MNRYILSLLLVFLPFCGKSQTSKYQIFDNYKLGIESNSVKFFIQDSLGLMWIGTDKGLSHFDGYTTYPHYTIGSKSNTIICCGILLKASHLLLGTERGVLLFNITTDKYEDFLPDFKHDIRSLIKVGDEIWLGCTDGLFIYNQVSGTLTELYQSNPKGLKHKMTYALLEKNGYVYLGSNGQLGRYSINDKVYELLDVSGVGGNYLINSLLDDDKRKCIWIGQGGVLLKYNLKTGELVNKGQFNVVKSMVIDADDNIIMGTDNGLYVYDGVHIKQCIVHDSREPNSLANDIVWSVYEDMMGNIWFGTVNGISIAPVYRRFNTLPISKITDTGEGNQFYSIFYDTKNNYWLGGTNGLIKSPENFNLSSNTHWYKMGGSPYKISHNHIRDIFEDKDQNLFVATDFGLNRYNNQTQEFIRYTITAKDGTLNANWPHAMLEDKQHRMWVASYNGGIFVIEKSKLLTTNSTPMADLHYSMRNGLSGNNVVSIVADKQDNIWALIQNSAINKIESSTGVITKYPIEKYTNGAIPNYLMSDSLGNI